MFHRLKAAASAKRLLLRNQEFAKLVQEELHHAFYPGQSDVEFLVENLKEAIEAAMRKGDLGAAMRGLTIASRWLGM